MIAFQVACVPPTANHQRKKIVRLKMKDGRSFSKLADKPELVAAKGMLDSILMPFQPLAPIAGAVAMTLEFTWPWLKSHSKKVRQLGRIPHTSRPDCSNATKTLEDRLVALRFLEDDKAVVDLRVRKWWGDEPGIAVTICALADSPVVPAPQPEEGLFSHVRA